jgi:hypothetical protein
LVGVEAARTITVKHLQYPKVCWLPSTGVSRIDRRK